MTPNIDLFKHCMSKFATGVTIITTIGLSGQRIGVTVNSFNSVSLDPLLILFSLKKSSHFFPHFASCKHCTVNILSQDQQGLSQLFAKPLEDNWLKVKLASGSTTDCPAIEGGLAFLECEVFARYEGGDHMIFVCKVINLVEQSQDEPLIYFGSKYRALRP